MLNITAARRAGQKTIDLNITPLIDMVFILLIFFLVTTSFVKETGVEVDKPVAQTAAPMKQAPLLIALTASNDIFMNSRPVELHALSLQVERALAENPDSNVVIVADKNSHTGAVINIMDTCRQAGAASISVAAGQPGRP